MKSLNVLSTNIGSFLNARDVRWAAKDCIKHFGQGEQIRFELYVYPSRKAVANLTPTIYRALPYRDPWGKRRDTLLETIRSTRGRGVKYQIFATLYTND